MLKRIFTIVLISVLALLSMAQENKKPYIKPPSDKALAEAVDMVEGLFKKLKDGKTEELADWITEQVGYTWDATTKVTKKNEFKSALDIIMISPPQSAYGKLDGYDKIDESYLPGSDRFFRFTYLSYHEGAPLVWEFRFYVKPDGKTPLNSIQWEDKNPFEYMSTPDMLMNRYYD